MTFTNNFQVALSVSLDNDGSAVSQVVYVLHGPVGWSVKQVQFTGGPLQHKESFVFYADRTTNSFSAYTLVNADTNINVNVYTEFKGQEQFINLIGIKINTPVNKNATADGTNGQQINTSISW